jgi:soluble lytic murein transglycosylase-like protein
MRYVIVVFIILLLAQLASAQEACSQKQSVLIQILETLKRNSSKKAVPAKRLAPAIMRLSCKYNVDPMIVTRVMLLESRGDASAYNAKTHDHGLMQLNDKTIARYGFDKERVYDWEYNLEAGVIILSRYKRLCIYNVGTAPLVGAQLHKCLHYETLVASIN